MLAFTLECGRFHGGSSFFKHNESREKAPSAYVVVDDRYILRYVSNTVPNLYKDAVRGIPAHYALYNYIDDPLEEHDLYVSMPEKAQQMVNVWERESSRLPKPAVWEEAKWSALVNSPETE